MLRRNTDVIMVLLEHGVDVFMDMRPFLKPEEILYPSVSYACNCE